MNLFDWLIVIVVFFSLGLIATYSGKYISSVADFLSGNRCAGRYLLVGAELMAAISATMFVANGERNYEGGFPVLWWMYCLITIQLIKALSGWVLYRFRETRAMTMAQFFEIRYSRKFRVFTGILAFISGVINYAIHPAVTSRLLVYFCGLPISVTLLGIQIPTVFIVMTIMLSIAVFLTISGGQIALMITDFFQGQLLLLTSLVIVLFLLIHFGWSDILEVLKNAPKGESKLNPFDQGNVSSFNVWFFVMVGFLSFYQEMAFQGNQGYFSAAKSPHEAKMSKIISIWRTIPIQLLFVITAIVAYVVFNSPNTSDAVSIQNKISQISDVWIQTQMKVPLTLRHILPIGLTGLLASVFIASSLSTDDTYLHAWGSIFIQDVIMPFRKKSLSKEKHIKLLKISVIFVAFLALILGSFIPFRDYVYMYFYVTFAIYGAGAGAVIIGGLYWKRGTTLGAWSAMLTGSILCSLGFVLRIVWSKVPVLTEMSQECPFNGMHISFVVSLISAITYYTVSIFSDTKGFDIDRMLHRGKYSINGEHINKTKPSFFQRLTGITNEFSVKDKIIAYTASVWVLVISLIVWAGNLYSVFGGTLSDDFWATTWKVFINFSIAVAVVIFFWFLIGGMSDVVKLFARLKILVRDDKDDGTVINNHNLSDELTQDEDHK